MDGVPAVGVFGGGHAVNEKKLDKTLEELESAVAGLVGGARGNASASPAGRGVVKRLVGELRRELEAAARQGEELARLATIVECSEDAILTKDLNGVIQSWNPAAERLFGYAGREVVGKSILILIPPDRVDEEALILRRLRKGQPVKHYETVRRRKDGTMVDVSISVSPLRNAAGRLCGAAKIVRDIGEQRRAEAAVRESAERMRAVVHAAVDAIITIDERGNIDSVNPATERLFGFTAAEMVGRNVKMLMPEPYRGEHDGYLRAYLRTGHAKIIGIGREVAGMRKDGTTFPMSLAVSEVALRGRRLFTGIVHDLSSRRQLEHQILEASVNEQRRIGQDLHDGLCQDLIGLAFGADAAARQLAASGVPDTQAIDRLAMSIREAAGQARRLSHGLNPVDLKAGGLPVALEGLAGRISDAFGVACAYVGADETSPMDDPTATHFYRIAQEAVTNSIRHGKAHEVRIGLHESGGRLVLTVADDGVGIGVNASRALAVDGSVNGGRPKVGIGLQGMRYRANLMGGTFEVGPGRTGGTVVVCSVPLASGKAGSTRPGRNGGGRPHAGGSASRPMRTRGGGA